MQEAYLYGADAASQPGTEGLNAFFLLVDKPEVYNLPPDPVVPTKNGERGVEVFHNRGVGVGGGGARIRIGAREFTAMNTGHSRLRYLESIDPVARISGCAN